MVVLGPTLWYSPWKHVYSSSLNCLVLWQMSFYSFRTPAGAIRAFHLFLPPVLDINNLLLDWIFFLPSLTLCNDLGVLIEECTNKSDAAYHYPYMEGFSPNCFPVHILSGKWYFSHHDAPIPHNIHYIINRYYIHTLSIWRIIQYFNVRGSWMDCKANAEPLSLWRADC